jgi:hypothetical protein
MCIYEKIVKFGLQLCSRVQSFSFSPFNCWVQSSPFGQSNKLDVQCIIIARKEGAKFSNHKVVGCLLLVLLSNCEVHHKLFEKASKTLRFELLNNPTPK